MTAIASWVNKEMMLKQNYPASIWTVGDSKVIDQSTNTNLSLESSKVFELDIFCHDTSTLPPRKIYFQHSIGYAYAGSSLVGLNCFATLHTILKNLGGGYGRIPDLFNIASTTKKIVEYYAKSICTPGNPFECIIYGFCPLNKQLERYYIYNDSESFKITRVPDNKMFLLGHNKNEIESRIKEEMHQIRDHDSIYYWRTPLRILSKITTSGEYDTIGGGTQLNIANQFGCTPFYAVGERGPSASRFRNIDLDLDIGYSIGACSISLFGMHYVYSPPDE